MCEPISATVASLFTAEAVTAAGAAAATTAAASGVAAGTAAAMAAGVAAFSPTLAAGIAGASGVAAATTATAGTSLATIASIGSLATGLAGAGLSAYGQMQAGQAAKQSALYRAAVADNNAKATLARGEFETQQVYRQGAQRLGAQRAAMGANNIDIGFGTALDIQRDTAEPTGIDAATTRYNALLAGTDQSQQAGLMRAQGAAAQTAGYIGAAGSILSGASQFGARWTSWKTGGADWQSSDKLSLSARTRP